MPTDSKARWSMEDAWNRNISLTPRESLLEMAKSLALLPPDEDENAEFLQCLLRFIEEMSHEEPV